MPNSEVDSDGEVEILCSMDEDTNLEVDSPLQSDPLMLSYEQSGLFEVQTPDDEEIVYSDFDNYISYDDNSDTEVVVESENSTSLVVDNAERVDGPLVRSLRLLENRDDAICVTQA